jgi:hypothetical protein
MVSADTAVEGTSLAFWVALVLVMACIWMFRADRVALRTLICMSILIPTGQGILFMNCNFMVSRILVAFGLLAIIKRRDWRFVRKSAVDRLMVAWVVMAVLTYTVLCSSMDAFKNRLGFAMDTLGVYLVARCLCREYGDILVVLKLLVMLGWGVTASIIYEKSTGTNPFASLGGVPFITEVRDGQLRAQGPFPHALLAGFFGAYLLPISLGLKWAAHPPGKFLWMSGMICSVVITFCTACSGPILALAVGLGVALFWRWRSHAGKMFYAGIVLLGCLQLVMKSPVWSLLGRIKIFGGSSAYHRYAILDEALNHLGEWWLIGCQSTEHWGYVMWDITNGYLKQGVQGGLVTMVLFIAVIVMAFRLLRRIYSLTWDEQASRLAWALCAALAGQSAAFLGMNVWGAARFIFILNLALIATLHQAIFSQPSPAVVREPSEPLGNLDHELVFQSRG